MTGPAQPGRRNQAYISRGLRLGTGAVAGAAAIALIAGCGSSGGSGPSSTAAKGEPASAHQAIVMAADSSQKINSATVTISAQVAGSTSATTSGTIKMSLKPSLQMSAAMKVAAAGKNLAISEVLTHNALYLKVPGLKKATGKQWMKITLAQLSSKTGIQFRQLLQSAQNGNPASQTRLLTAAKNAKAEGTQTINGVTCTKYVGSYTAAQGKAALPPAERKALGQSLSKVTGAVHFTAWIDAQHHVRKIISSETVSGQQVNETTSLTSINQPVTVQAPPASQVAPMPKNLGGGNSSL
jgi:hypothetical protein